jgi:hypothetical protein
MVNRPPGTGRMPMSGLGFRHPSCPDPRDTVCMMLTVALAEHHRARDNDGHAIAETAT